MMPLFARTSRLREASRRDWLLIFNDGIPEAMSESGNISATTACWIGLHC
jgi:hypothetical protein